MLQGVLEEMKGVGGTLKKQYQIQHGLWNPLLQFEFWPFSYYLHDLEQPYCIYNIDIEIPVYRVLKELNVMM